MSGFNRGGGGGFGQQRSYGRGDDNYGSGGGGNTVDMFVPAGDCGKIIGRGGMKIRELQDASGAKITVSRDDEGDGTRRVTLSGGDDNIEEARALIMDILENGDDRRGGGGGGGGGFSSYGGGGGGGGGGSRETIQIDSSFVGRIIGKGGSKIRELQDETGCRISVSRDGGRYGQTDVELIGSRYNIQKAKEAIDDITSQQY